MQVSSYDLILVPCQPDHEEVENGQEDKKDRVRISVTIYLIEDEKNKYYYGWRIRPEFSSQESNCQEYFDDAVAQEIEGSKQLWVLG